MIRLLSNLAPRYGRLSRTIFPLLFSLLLGLYASLPRRPNAFIRLRTFFLHFYSCYHYSRYLFSISQTCTLLQMQIFTSLGERLFTILKKMNYHNFDQVDNNLLNLTF